MLRHRVENATRVIFTVRDSSDVQKWKKSVQKLKSVRKAFQSVPERSGVEKTFRSTNNSSEFVFKREIVKFKTLSFGVDMSTLRRYKVLDWMCFSEVRTTFRQC